MRILQDDFERGRDLFLARAAADIEEIGRAAAEMLDDVHGGHGQARAVDQAGDVTVEFDVIEIEFAGFDFQRRFLVQVAHVLDVLVPVKRVVIEAEILASTAIRVSLPSAPATMQSGIDFDQGGVAFPPGFKNAGDQLGGGVESNRL